MLKTTILVLCVLSAAAAFGQSTAGAGAISADIQPLRMSDHPQRAMLQQPTQTVSLLEGSAATFGTGERPLWEFATAKTETPLGDVARAFRKDHAQVKKAVRTLEK